MSDFRHRKMNILPVTAAVLLCLCLLSFTRVGSVYGRLTEEDETLSQYATGSDASRYYDYSKSMPSDVERIEVESNVIEIPEPDPIEGYEFLGWNTCEDGSGNWYFPGELFEMTEECTDFYAIWEKVLKATPSQAVKAASGSDAVRAGGDGALAAPAAVQPEKTSRVVAETTEAPESAEVAESESTGEKAEISAGVREITEVEEVTEVSGIGIITETVETEGTTEAAETPEA